MIKRIKAIWHHYSTWVLVALGALGGLWEFVPQFQEYLPRWVVAVLAFLGLFCKLIPQKVPQQPTISEVVEDRRRA